MFYFIVWVGLCFLVAMIGTNKNIGYWTTFLISLIFSPLIGLIFALASKEKNSCKRIHLQTLWH
jgi:fucose permease